MAPPGMLSRHVFLFCWHYVLFFPLPSPASFTNNHQFESTHTHTHSLSLFVCIETVRYGAGFSVLKAVFWYKRWPESYNNNNNSGSNSGRCQEIRSPPGARRGAKGGGEFFPRRRTEGWADGSSFCAVDPCTQFSCYVGMWVFVVLCNGCFRVWDQALRVLEISPPFRPGAIESKR